MRSLADQLKQLGYQDSREDKNYERVLYHKTTKALKDGTARKTRLDAQPKDAVLELAYEINKNAIYKITAYVDSIKPDKKYKDITVVSVNCLHIIIDGELFVADHIHLRSDEINIDSTWDINDEIVFEARVDKYRGKGKNRQNKYRLCNK